MYESINYLDPIQRFVIISRVTATEMYVKYFKVKMVQSLVVELYTILCYK